ncbi:hypothetical protein BS47DRAFT_1365336 [Hydnum rufescens UP504]|uniref:Uncharacterized protein n=1 Tax=Hydnum rufescens UP504 TaxID=1448309 RepID=A0A9P6AP83_9AGAM|nr:hypothetical protein BS47DRAFT_1365336 [Hydnum rufescens UP504]
MSRSFVNRPYSPDSNIIVDLENIRDHQHHCLLGCKGHHPGYNNNDEHERELPTQPSSSAKAEEASPLPVPYGWTMGKVLWVSDCTSTQNTTNKDCSESLAQNHTWVSSENAGTCPFKLGQGLEVKTVMKEPGWRIHQLVRSKRKNDQYPLQKSSLFKTPGRHEQSWVHQSGGTPTNPQSPVVNMLRAQLLGFPQRVWMKEPHKGIHMDELPNQLTVVELRIPLGFR